MTFLRILFKQFIIRYSCHHLDAYLQNCLSWSLAVIHLLAIPVQNTKVLKRETERSANKSTLSPAESPDRFHPNLLATLFVSLDAESGFVGDERHDAGIEFGRRKRGRGDADAAQLQHVGEDRLLLRGRKIRIMSAGWFSHSWKNNDAMTLEPMDRGPSSTQLTLILGDIPS